MIRDLGWALLAVLGAVAAVSAFACSGALLLAGSMVLFGSIGVGLSVLGVLVCAHAAGRATWRLLARHAAALANVAATLALSSALVLAYVGLAYAS